MEAPTDSTLDTKDYWCRNCEFRFVPTCWIGGGASSYLVPQCPHCGSNATEEYINQQVNEELDKIIDDDIVHGETDREFQERQEQKDNDKKE